MHHNADVIKTLYTALDRHDPSAMCDCYHRDATFRDIAFQLKTKNEICAMWRMIAETDLRATFHVTYADAETAVAELTDVYTFRDTQNKVRNEIRSEFRFREGKIIEHRDLCSALDWSVQAFGPIGGFLAWLVPPIRRCLAQNKLVAFMARPASDSTKK